MELDSLVENQSVSEEARERAEKESIKEDYE